MQPWAAIVLTIVWLACAALLFYGAVMMDKGTPSEALVLISLLCLVALELRYPPPPPTAR